MFQLEHPCSCTFFELHPTEISKVYSSGWFNWTEPSPTTSLQGTQGVQGAICTGLGEVQAHRTFSNYIITSIIIEFAYMISGWFDYIDQQKVQPGTPLTVVSSVQAVVACYATVPGFAH